jgi:hypothetical protein
MMRIQQDFVRLRYMILTADKLLLPQVVVVQQIIRIVSKSVAARESINPGTNVKSMV